MMNWMCRLRIAAAACELGEDDMSLHKYSFSAFPKSSSMSANVSSEIGDDAMLPILASRNLVQRPALSASPRKPDAPSPKNENDDSVSTASPASSIMPRRTMTSTWRRRRRTSLGVASIDSRSVPSSSTSCWDCSSAPGATAAASVLSISISVRCEFDIGHETGGEKCTVDKPTSARSFQ